MGSLKGGGETDCPQSKGDQDILIESLLVLNKNVSKLQKGFSNLQLFF